MDGYPPGGPVRTGDLPDSDLTVMVVDDDALVRSVVALTLRDRGFSVVEEEDGLAAVSAISEDAPGPVDLLITDIVMPGMGGKELALRFRELCPGAPIVFISGDARAQAFTSGLPGDGSILLRKPFMPSELAEVVHRALASRHGPGGVPGEQPDRW